MGKKIPDIESKILNAACEIFRENGYAETSMKDIALRAGAAVGSLYTYYPTKKELFVASRTRVLEEFEMKFLTGDDNSGNPRQKLEKALFRLFENMSHGGSLMDGFLESSRTELTPEERKAILKGISADFRIHIVEKLHALLCQCLGPRSAELTATDGVRLSLTLISLLKDLDRYYPDEDEKNRAFIVGYLDLLCTQGESR